MKELELDKDMSTSEVASHLRAATKMFRNLEFATNAVNIVLSHEKIVGELEREAEMLRQEKEQLNKDCDEAVAKANAAEEQIKTHEQAVVDAAKKAEDKAAAERAKVKVEVKATIAEANEAVNKILDGTKEATAKKTEAQAALKAAEQELLTITTQVSKAKESFMRALG